jgi:hypothetical protein
MRATWAAVSHTTTVAPESPSTHRHSSAEFVGYYRHDDRAGAGRGEVDERELDAGVAQHADPIARLHAELDQAPCEVGDAAPQLGEA